MNIFINALSARLGGGQTYLLNLLGHIPFKHNFIVYILVQPSFDLPDLPSNVTRLVQYSVENPLLRALWEKFHLMPLLTKLKIDVFFFTRWVVA